MPPKRVPGATWPKQQQFDIKTSNENRNNLTPYFLAKIWVPRYGLKRSTQMIPKTRPGEKQSGLPCETLSQVRVARPRFGPLGALTSNSGPDSR